MSTTAPTSEHARAADHRPGSMLSQLETWCGLFEGCQRIEGLRARHQATAVGVIQRLRLIPGESMEATIFDGTAKLKAVWTGEPISGLELGRGLLVEGVVCTDSGMPVMRNPTWRMVRDPYACAEAMAAERADERAGERAGVRSTQRSNLG